MSLIGLLADNKEHFGIDEVTFHKRTPLLTEKAKVADLEEEALCCPSTKSGSRHSRNWATPPSTGPRGDRTCHRRHRLHAGGHRHERGVLQHAEGPRGWRPRARSSGSGKMYARGINDSALVAGDDRFLQIVSCNTHNIAALVRSLAIDADGTNHPKTVASSA